MKISIQNYEAFVLDFIEGNLSEQKQAEMLLFLEQNPYLQTEIDALLDENLILTADETIVFEDKAILKHHDKSAMIGFRRIWPPIMLLAAAIFAIFAMNENIWNNSLNIQNAKPVISQQTNFKIDTTAIEDTLCNIVNSDLYLAENQAVIEEKITQNNSLNRIEKPKNLKPKSSIKETFAIAKTKKVSHRNTFDTVAIANTATHQTVALSFEKPKQEVAILDVLPTKALTRKVSVSQVATLPMRNVAQIEIVSPNNYSTPKQRVATIEHEQIIKQNNEKQELLPFKLSIDTEELTSDIVSKVLPKQKQLKKGDFSLLNDLKSAFVPQAYSNDTEQKTTAIHISVPVESKHLRFIQKVWDKQDKQ